MSQILIGQILALGSKQLFVSGLIRIGSGR